MASKPTPQHPRGRTRFSWRSFAQDSGGSVAILFAVVLLVVATVALAQIDISRTATVKQRLQDALDAGTLAAARSNGDDATVKKIGQDFLAAQTQSSGATNISATFKPSEKSVEGVLTADLNPYFSQIFMKGPIKLRVESVVLRDTDSALEVALVLDTTGSMSGTKIATLKTAATDLVTKITANKNPNVRIAVVPFAQHVNVGVSRRNEPWITVDPDWSELITPQPGQICYEDVNCSYRTATCTSTNDGITTTYSCQQKYNCTRLTYSPCKTVPAAAPYTKWHKWSGCVGSPDYPKNVEDNDPTRKYPGFLDMSCSAELTPLTNDAAKVTKAIKALSASGETYIPAGLAWGWNVLSPGVPFTDGAAYDPSGKNKKPRKVLVLMTDGENTKLMHTGAGVNKGKHTDSPPGNSPAKQANDWTEKLCENINSAHIEVFSVAFEVDDQNAKKLVEKCASDPAHYFDATDSTALLAAFSQIAQALQNLRISR
jgi:Flp pilus assembly protein TadG